MIAKKIWAIYLFTGFYVLTFAQAKSKKVDVLWGPEQKEAKKSTLNDIVGFDETGIYAIKKKSKSLYGIVKPTITLEHYNNQMTPTKSASIDFEKQNKSRSFEFMMHLNNQLYAFSSYKNPNNKQNELYLQRVDKSTLKPSNKLVKLAKINFKGNSKRNAGNYNYKISRDSSKVLIYYNLPYDKYASEKFGLHVFDNQFNQLWEKQVTLPYREELFSVEDFEVDVQGNVHLLGIIYKNKGKKKRKGKPNYIYQLLSYYNNGNQLKEYPIQIEGKFLTDMQVAINDEQDIICGGFYSNVGSFSIIGSYFLKIDEATQQIETKSFDEFGIDFITQNMTKRREEKSKKKAAKGKSVELFEYDLDDIIIKDDGGAVLVGEQFYVQTVSSSIPTAGGGRTWNTTYFYNFNDIIVINVDPDGAIKWTEKIAKRQTTASTGFFSSFVYSVLNNNIYFVFNDNPKNLFYKGEGRIHNFNNGKESLIVLVELNKNGKQTREALFSAKDADVLARPAVCEQISPKQLVLFGERKKTHRFAKITFK